MVFRRVLFFSVIIACEVLSSFTQFHLKGGKQIFGNAITTNLYHLRQDQLELAFMHFIHAKRNRRDANSSVEENNEKNADENYDATQYSENQSDDAKENEENEARQKQRICKGLPLCGRKNGDRRRQKRLTENITNYNLKRGVDLLMNSERNRHKDQVDTYIRSLVNLEEIKGKNVNQLNEEVKPSQANCIGWFRRQGSSSTTSSSVDAAGSGAAGGGDADTGGDADDSNLQTSRRLRARRRTTTRRSRHN